MSGDLIHELKKRDPFDSLEQEALLNLVRTNDQLQNRFGRLFRQYGLTWTQYNILRILRGEGRPLPILEIASRMVAVAPGITGLIDRLEKAGFVVRRRSDDDRRVVYIEATAAANELLKRLDEPVREMHLTLLGRLTQGELRQLIDLLQKARTLDEPDANAGGTIGTAPDDEIPC